MYRKLLVLSVIAFSIFACNEDSEPEAIRLDLAGQWLYVRPYPNGSEQQVLDIKADSSIVIKYLLFGVQPDTEPDELNATIDCYGQLIVDQDQVEFNIDECIYRDFYFGTGPDTLVNQTVFFDQCFYRILGDTLILDYVSYPADLPVRGERKFVNIN